MKKYLSLSVTIIGLLILTAAFVNKPLQKLSVPPTDSKLCHSIDDPIMAFASFANNKEFRDAHALPRPFKPRAKQLKGKMVDFKTPGAEKGHAYLVKAPKKSNQYLFMFHEWWGLNEYVKDEAAFWAEQLGDVNVLAIDLYDGKVATTREDAGKLMQGVDSDRAEDIIKGAISYAGQGAKLASIGWCFGGGWSLQSAIIARHSMEACVMYYGMPIQDEELLETKLETNVLGIFAKQDRWITPEVVKEFEENMKKAGKELTVAMYDADHAFANPSSPKYDEEAAKDAREKVRRYLELVF
ncbi:dienelactone hydrolase family protein [Limibacter armeniacum]|uniref:dienelactone hydrolase family protein n=1 Tax=Limibacter armeniacum TaxID=466084 RepID=UPI002FE590C2